MNELEELKEWFEKLEEIQLQAIVIASCMEDRKDA